MLLAAKTLHQLSFHEPCVPALLGHDTFMQTWSSLVDNDDDKVCTNDAAVLRYHCHNNLLTQSVLLHCQVSHCMAGLFVNIALWEECVLLCIAPHKLHLPTY